MDNSYLIHYGVKGMRWGVRRHRNENTMLLTSGRSRNDADNEQRNERKKKIMDDVFSDTVKGGKDKPNVSPAEKILKDSGNAIDNGVKLCNSISAIKRTKNSKSASRSMSNKELQDAITRMNLERQYSSLMNERSVSKGSTYLKESLEIIGSIAAIGASAAAIITTVNTLKK